MTTRQLTVTLCSAALLIGGVAFVVRGVLHEGKDYVPLAGSIISGAATLIGVFVGALVLRFNYMSQANPIKLELYKKQSDAYLKLYSEMFTIHHTVHYMLRKGVIERDLSRYKEAIRNLLIGFMKEKIKYDLLLPNEVQWDLVLWMNELEDIVRYADLIGGVNSAEGVDVDKLAKDGQEPFLRAANFMRERLGTEKLSSDLFKMMGKSDAGKNLEKM